MKQFICINIFPAHRYIQPNITGLNAHNILAYLICIFSMLCPFKVIYNLLTLDKPF